MPAVYQAFGAECFQGQALRSQPMLRGWLCTSGVSPASSFLLLVLGGDRGDTGHCGDRRSWSQCSPGACVVGRLRSCSWTDNSNNMKANIYQAIAVRTARCRAAPVFPDTGWAAPVGYRCHICLGAVSAYVEFLKQEGHSASFSRLVPGHRRRESPPSDVPWAAEGDPHSFVSFTQRLPRAWH